jgi:4,5-DOPA dioxygenase extradiol
MMPSLFICHGAPSLAIENNEYTAFLNQLGAQIEKPKAIVVFTAHWESDVLSMTYTDDVYETIYDFGGFSEELRSVKYPVKGSKAVADALSDLLTEKGIASRKDSQRGLDHGTWVVLRLLYPDADIPVVQVSVNPDLSIEEQYRVGAAIADMKNQGVLIVGSGGTVHNLRMIQWGQKEPEAWAEQFDDWLVDRVLAWDTESIFTYDQLAPHAKLAVPRAEHFVPLPILMGSADDRRQAKLLHRSYDYGTLSHICFSF